MIRIRRPFPAQRAGVLVLCVGLLMAAEARASTLPAVSTGQIRVHLDADEGVTTDGNGVVMGPTGWTDLSGHGNHFGFAEGSPTLVPGAFNGQAVIRFNASDGVDRLANFTGDLFELSGTPFTLFAVTRHNSNVDGLFTTHGGLFANTIRTAFGIVQIPGDNGAPIGADAAGSVTSFRFSLDDDPSTPQMIDVRHYETFLRSVSTAGPYGEFYSESQSLGGVWQGTVLGDSDGIPLTGDLAEFVVYEGDLSDSDRQLVETALANSYQVPEPATAVLLLLAALLWRRSGRSGM